MKKTIEIKYKRQKPKTMKIRYIEVNESSYRFNGKVEESTLFVFKHSQRHTRLDLTNLREQCIISFDKYCRVVGFKAVSNVGNGPYELYSKERIFIMTSEAQIKGFEGVESIGL